MNVNPCTVHVTSFDLSKAVTFSKLFSKVKLNQSARLVLRCLIDFWNPKKGLVYPGQEFIAEATGVSVRSVKSAVEELRNAGLILTTKKGTHLNYYFTAKFFEILEIAPNTCSDSTIKSETASPTCHEQHEREQIKNKVISFSLKTDFQKKYEDIISTLSGYDLEKYKALPGYEKENFLKAIKKDISAKQNSLELQKKLEKDRHNIGLSPMDNLEIALKFINSFSEVDLKNTLIRNQVQRVKEKWNL